MAVPAASISHHEASWGMKPTCRRRKSKKLKGTYIAGTAGSRLAWNHPSPGEVISNALIHMGRPAHCGWCHPLAGILDCALGERELRNSVHSLISSS